MHCRTALHSSLCTLHLWWMQTWSVLVGLLRLWRPTQPVWWRKESRATPQITMTSGDHSGLWAKWIWILQRCFLVGKHAMKHAKQSHHKASCHRCHRHRDFFPSNNSSKKNASQPGSGSNWHKQTEKIQQHQQQKGAPIQASTTFKVRISFSGTSV